jgi:predicted nucleic acid-binding protein
MKSKFCLSSSRRFLSLYAVFQELHEDGASEKVKAWIASPPSWLELRSASSAKVQFLPNLDLGEREAIQLALELNIRMVLMDDSDGRAEAKALKLKVRGTLGLLEQAGRMGKLDFRSALSKLRQTNFHVSQDLLAKFLERNL